MRIIAHRGFCRDHCENTLAAFQAALDFGVREMECDIRETPDGTLLLMHDETLERLAGEPIAVKDGLDALRSHHAVATLDELLQILPEDVILHLDLKDCSPEKVIPAARLLGDRATVATADVELLRRMKNAAPDLHYGFQPRTLSIEKALGITKEFKATSVRLNIDRVTLEWLAAARDARLEIFVYPVDTPEAMDRMRVLGVDAVF
ncbi:MAG: hypothetical protein COB53_12040, partial [Elusimicrobia bacterium]